MRNASVMRIIFPIRIISRASGSKAPLKYSKYILPDMGTGRKAVILVFGDMETLEIKFNYEVNQRLDAAKYRI